jgi:endoglucanase
MSEQTSLPLQAPEIGAEQIALLEKLSNACAVSGDEGEVRAIVSEQLKPIADEFKIDTLGNILVTRRAKVENAPRIMLAAHMDEIGFMLVDEEEGGLYRFDTVGGIDVRQLVGKSVLVGKQHAPGIIGARPIHLTTADERKRAISLDGLRIDLGPGGKAKVGDRATFATTFKQTGPSILGKALDDRVGVATLIELIKHAPPEIELLTAFTVQEEIGLRGAKTAAYTFNPDLAVAVDCTPANDLPTWDDSENRYYNTRLDAGPAIYVADGGAISTPKLVRWLVETAEAKNIPYQFRQPGGGTTDASAIQKARAGIPTLAISLPGRYAHTATMLARLSDWQNLLALLYAGLQNWKMAVSA